MIIRPAIARDAAALAKIRAPLVAETTTTFTSILPTADSVADEIAEAKAEGWAYLVAETDGSILGYASYHPFRSGPGYAATKEVSVNLAPHARRSGVGRVLMVRLEAHAARSGIEMLVAGISGENAAAIAFHAALGFVTVAQMPGVGQKFGRKLDLVLMQKSLVALSHAAPED